MPGRKADRAHLSEQERRLRSELRQLVSRDGFVRGTISVREKVCGKPGCRCARGQKHRAVYLVASINGKYRQLYIPSVLESRVTEWVTTYQRMREVLEELSRLHWEKLRRKKS
jgi:hypothetical protein